MKHLQDYSAEQDDASLVASTLVGDQEAFGILVQRYAPSVQRLCTRLLGTTVEAQDIVQEAALQAFLGLSHLREPARFAAWFHAIAANLARSALRRQRESSLQALGKEIMTHLTWNDPPPTLEAYLSEREMQETIVQALQNLSPVYRQALVGFYLQGYHYEELAALLRIPVSTLKWRLFEGRRLLKADLQPLAETLLPSVKKPPRKETSMMTEDVVLLHLDSLRHLPFTRQYLAILRDPTGPSVLPVALNEAEFNALEMVLRAQPDTSVALIPQDLSQRLLESFGARLQQVVIKTLVGQILYATATFKQGTRVRSIDMRLAEAVILAVLENVPISVTRALFEARASRDLTHPVQVLSARELHAQRYAPRNLGHEERLQWEEALRRQYDTARHRRMTKPWERLWAMLLLSLSGSPDAVSAEELRALDLAATFPTREVIWDGQPMLAVELPSQEEASWLVVSPALWESIAQQWHILRDPEHQDTPPSLATDSVPDALTPRTEAQAEAMLAQVVALPSVRTALLLTPAGNIAAWQGPETRERLQRFCETNTDLFRPNLPQEQELRPQGLKMFVIFSPKKETSEQGSLEMSGTDQVLAYHGHGWRLVVFFQEPPAGQEQEHTSRRIKEAWQSFLHLLIQRAQD